MGEPYEFDWTDYPDFLHFNVLDNLGRPVRGGSQAEV